MLPIMLIDLHHTRVNEPDTDCSYRLCAALVEDLVPGDGIAVVSEDESLEGYAHLAFEFGDPGAKAIVGGGVELRDY